MQRKIIKFESHSAQTVSSQSHADSGAAGARKEHRPASLSKQEVKVEKEVRPGALHFWQGIGKQVNDNPVSAVRSRVLLFGVSCVLLTAGIIACANSSAFMTWAVMHTDDSVLSAAMEVSPEAVAFALNQINVGE